MGQLARGALAKTSVLWWGASVGFMWVMLAGHMVHHHDRHDGLLEYPMMVALSLAITGTLCAAAERIRDDRIEALVGIAADATRGQTRPALRAARDGQRG